MVAKNCDQGLVLKLQAKSCWALVSGEEPASQPQAGTSVLVLSDRFFCCLRDAVYSFFARVETPCVLRLHRSSCAG